MWRTDPLTGQYDWLPIEVPEGGIIGVASPSQDKPIKVAGFPAVDADFAKAECYCDWKFIYSPRFIRHRRASRAAGQR